MMAGATNAAFMSSRREVSREVGFPGSDIDVLPDPGWEPSLRNPWAKLRTTRSRDEPARRPCSVSADTTQVSTTSRHARFVPRGRDSVLTLGNLLPSARIALVKLRPREPLPSARPARRLTRTMSDWERFSAEVYHERRYRNWIISEEMGDVRFLPEVGVVMVHRVRAEHIVRELLTNGQPVRAPAPRRVSIATRAPGPPVTAAGRSADAIPVSIRQTAARARAQEARAQKATPISRARIVTGSLGLGTAAGVFIAALAIRLDDSALLLALSLFLWAGRLILEDGPIPA
jgi:hypothetical protein